MGDLCDKNDKDKFIRDETFVRPIVPNIKRVNKQIGD